MLDNLYRILLIIAPIIGFVRWRYLDTPLRIYLGFCSFNFLISTASVIIGPVMGIKTDLPFYINIIFSLIVLILYFRFFLSNKFIKLFSPFFIIPPIIYVVFELNSWDKIIDIDLFIYHDIIIVLIGTAFLIQIFNKYTGELRKYSHFWICCNILFYYNFDLIFSFIISNLYDYLYKIFDLLYYKIAPLFSITFIIINSYIFYKTKDWYKFSKN